MDEESKLDDVFDETTGSANQPPLGSQEKTKRAPRKRFRWNEDIRCVLEKCRGEGGSNHDSCL